MLKKIFSALVVFFLFAGIALAQYEYDRVRPSQPEIPLSPLPSSVLRSLDLGLHSTLASFLWLKVIQDVGTWLGEFDRVDRDIRLINDVDPKFSYPYAFAVILLPELGHIDAAIEIGKRGIENVPNDWQIPYYLAADYHIYKKDRKNAAYYFDVAARAPDAPERIAHVAKTYGTGNDTLQEMILIWEGIYETSRDEITKERARQYLLYFETLENKQ